MNRRSFLASLTATAGASVLVLPYEPKRVYSFGEGVGRVVVPEPGIVSERAMLLYRTIAVSREELAAMYPEAHQNEADDEYSIRVSMVGAYDTPMARLDIVEGLLGYVDPDGNPKPLITRAHALSLLELE